MSDLIIGHVGNVMSTQDLYTRYQSSPTSAVNGSETNLITGSRSPVWRSSQSDYGIIVEFNNSTAFSPNFLFIGNLNLSIERNESHDKVVLYSISSADASDYSTGVELLIPTGSTSLTKSDLIGPREVDYVHTFAPPSTDKQFNRFILFSSSTSTAIEWVLTHTILCESFDFGHDPSASFTVTQQYDRAWKRLKPKVIDVTWRGVTGAKLDTFTSLIMPWADVSPIVLYEDPIDAVLGGDKCFLCWIKSFDARAITSDTNEVRMKLEEVL